jgi:hypothetical protein
MTGYGDAPGLLQRLAKWRDMMCTNRGLPWHGLGFIKDLELVMKLLNLREYAEWLKVHGDDEQRQFADEIMADQETLDAVRQATHDAGYRDVDDPVRAVELLAEECNAQRFNAMRQVLIDTGALAADDEETNEADLLRALLS